MEHLTAHWPIIGHFKAHYGLKLVQKTNRTGVIALVSVQIGPYFREKKARALPGYTYLSKIKIKVVVIHVRQLLILV